MKRNVGVALNLESNFGRRDGVALNLESNFGRRDGVALNLESNVIFGFFRMGALQFVPARAALGQIFSWDLNPFAGQTQRI